MQIDNHLLKRVSSRNLNPAVDFLFYGRHIEISIWRQTLPPIAWLLQHMADGCKMTPR